MSCARYGRLVLGLLCFAAAPYSRNALAGQKSEDAVRKDAAELKTAMCLHPARKKMLYALNSENRYAAILASPVIRHVEIKKRLAEKHAPSIQKDVDAELSSFASQVSNHVMKLASTHATQMAAQDLGMNLPNTLGSIPVE